MVPADRRYPVIVTAIAHAVTRWRALPTVAVLIAVAGGLAFLGYTFLIQGPASRIAGADAFAYWSVDLRDPYHARVGDFGAFTYSPPMAGLASLAGLLPWRTFLTLWTVLLVAVAVWLGGRRALLVLAFPPVAIELYYGNINLLLAVALVLGMTRPWAWTFVLLTKPTCGVGLLWFAARREWRQLGIALGLTFAVVAASLLVMPGAWRDWVALLLESGQRPPTDTWLPIPIWLRLPVAGALAWWGARTDRPWTVPAAATLALPVVWFAGLAVLVAALRIESRSSSAPATAPAPVFESRPSVARAA
jgi:hypothetical protein